MRTGEIAGTLDVGLERRLADTWDNSGLLVGDPHRPARRALLTLDVTAETIREAVRAGAELIVSHHPVIFDPLKTVNEETPKGSLVSEIIRRRLAVYAAHTNVDRMQGGINDRLAALAGIREPRPLASVSGRGNVKIVTFLPEKDIPRVRAALCASGAGVIGEYRECSFSAPGTGTFRGGAASNPRVGQKGRFETVAERRLEVVVPADRIAAVVAAMRKVHSYETPAYDVYPLVEVSPGAGYGRWGDLEKPVRAGDWLRRLRRALKSSVVRTTGDLRRRVKRVAVCGGAGGEFLREALSRGVELYVTGDVRHHHFDEAASAGVILADAGHAETDWAGFAAAVRAFWKREARLRDVALVVSRSPWNVICAEKG
ncbi:MAG: Nif3-like dinuclear metal center hexameric protein [Planctomycetota bacterium]